MLPGTPKVCASTGVARQEAMQAVMKHADVKVCEPTCAHLTVSVSVCGACRYLT